MPATTIEITEDLPYDFTRVRVYTSPSLLNFEWTERPFLHPTSLSKLAGPDIDQANLEMEFGFFTHRSDSPFGGPPIEGEIIEPLEIDREYLKIEFLDDEGEVADMWVGRVAFESQDASVRSRLIDEENEQECKSGVQKFVVYGLLWELEHTVIASSFVRQVLLVGEQTTDIERGIPFNLVDRAGGYVLRGNQAVDDLDRPLFSWAPHSDTKWTAKTAIEYLCLRHSPQTPGGNESVAIDPVGADLSWYDISVETDRRSFKAILDELVDRRRLAGYYLRPKEVGGSVLCDLELFTFTDVDLDIGEDTIPANEDQVELVVRSNAITASAVVRSVATHVADRVIVEGAWITSTFSIDEAFGGGLQPGWEDERENEYEAASGTDDEILNTAIRSRDKFKDVYSRFTLPDYWTPLTISQSGKFYRVTVQPESLPDVLADEDLDALFVSTVDDNPWRFQAARFLDYIALKDEDTDEFRRPFVIFKDEQLSTEDEFRFVYADQAAVGERQFACNLHMLNDTLGIQLVVNKSGGNSLLAKNHYDDASATPEDLDPTDSGNLAFDYEDLFLTATVEWDDRVSASITINGSGDGTSRVQRIMVADARLDIALPGTILDIDSDGKVQRTETGQVLRDDRARLRTIAEAAAAWYGTPRQAITLTYHSLRQFVDIGQLMMAFVDGDLVEDVNTPITGVVMDFVNGTTTIETSYAEADFSSNRAGVGT